ncbi:protein MADS AFFECTING FLOWERING 5-like [Impatiens glandulifera]|uniref:protein MADS AFFECTING FLOWERING 5-like n=1 Tax=Impatiens glandulifera TaxID=253017 RepID=UPI001FB19860|nr:protein MADS AFFECTING FLOWERING 5-like [Impatiens glandulifera]
MTKETPETDGRRNNRGQGKKKIEIKRIENKSQRMVCFSKRKASLFQAVTQFQQSTGHQDVAAVVFSPAGQMYTSGNSGPAFDVVVDRILQLSDPSTVEDIKGDDSDDSGLLIGWILNSMGFDDLELQDLQHLAAMKTDLEKMKGEVDKRISRSGSSC